MSSNQTRNSYDHNATSSKPFSSICRLVARPLLPSTYIRKILPTNLYRWACYSSYIFWFIIGLLVLRKTLSATTAVRYIKEHGHTVSLKLIEESINFSELIKQIERDFDSLDGKQKAPAFFLLNQHALNMTFNFLCNTKVYPGVHERFVFVTLDSTARDVLAQYWPNIRQFYWPTPSLYVSYYICIIFKNTG